jgi:hypothetical protein
MFSTDTHEIETIPTLDRNQPRATAMFPCSRMVTSTNTYLENTIEMQVVKFERTAELMRKWQDDKLIKCLFHMQIQEPNASEENQRVLSETHSLE